MGSLHGSFPGWDRRTEGERDPESDGTRHKLFYSISYPLLTWTLEGKYASIYSGIRFYVSHLIQVATWELFKSNARISNGFYAWCDHDQSCHQGSSWCNLCLFFNSSLNHSRCECSPRFHLTRNIVVWERIRDDDYDDDDDDEVGFVRMYDVVFVDSICFLPFRCRLAQGRQS